MRQFHILIRSFQDMERFVSLAMVQPFEVQVGNEQMRINGKNYIGMSTLDYSQPLTVLVTCTEEEFLHFRQEAAAFVI